MYVYGSNVAALQEKVPLGFVQDLIAKITIQKTQNYLLRAILHTFLHGKVIKSLFYYLGSARYIHVHVHVHTYVLCKSLIEPFIMLYTITANIYTYTALCV